MIEEPPVSAIFLISVEQKAHEGDVTFSHIQLVHFGIQAYIHSRVCRVIRVLHVLHEKIWARVRHM